MSANFCKATALLHQSSIRTEEDFACIENKYDYIVD